MNTLSPDNDWVPRNVMTFKKKGLKTYYCDKKFIVTAESDLNGYICCFRNLYFTCKL